MLSKTKSTYPFKIPFEEEFIKIVSSTDSNARSTVTLNV